MKSVPYTLRGILDLWLLLPLTGHILAGMAGLTASALGNLWVATAFFILAMVALAFLSLWAGRRLVHRTMEKQPDFRPSLQWATRYRPVVWMTVFSLITALVGLFTPISEDGSVFARFQTIFGLAHLPGSVFLLLASFMAPVGPWPFLGVIFGITAFYFVGMVLAFRRLRVPRTQPQGRIVAIMVILVAASAMTWRIQQVRSAVWQGSGPDLFDEKSVLAQYSVGMEDNSLVKVADPTLKITGDCPILDGATAAYPIYAAAARAIYTEPDLNLYEVVKSSTTPEAYKELIAGKVDVIFAIQPSTAQRAAADEAGVTLHLTPIGREAFVFFVNAENPVSNLTSEQIRDIYTKRILRWSEVGGLNEKIVAFQRPEGSGSQTALERKVMLNEKPMQPQREEVARGMGGVMQRVAAFRNSRESIGYSFRFYATMMNPTAGLKLLEIDGVAPTRETIRDGTYPYTVDLYAITAGSKNPHVPELIRWFLSPQGQKLVDDTGYVSLNP